MTETDSVTDNSLKTRTLSALILGVIVLSAVYRGGIAFKLLLVVMAVIGIYEWCRMVRADQRYRIPLMLFGVCYIGIASVMMGLIRLYSAYGLYDMLTLLLIVWASDISAYFSGKSIGGPKLAPAISPKKTWAGF